MQVANSEQLDRLMMQRAFVLAQLGQGKVSPNPMVGCVIAHDDKILAEGWHKAYGEAHAEVNALKALEKVAHKPKELTVYVSLEPCSHFGKTPPCADALIRLKPKRVVVANLDPNPLVAGKGLEKLKAAGIEVTEGVETEAGRELNRRFFTFFEQKRPYIILKWAETADGFIAKSNFEAVQISCPLAKKLLHQWRSQEDAILVGKNTALYDNPQLTTREWSGKSPLRIVIDHKLTLPADLRLFNDDLATWQFNLIQNQKRGKWEQIALPEEHFLENLLNTLWKRGIQSLIVEGGSKTLQQFIDAGLWDEIRQFCSVKKTLNSGILAPNWQGLIAQRHTLGYQEDWLTYAYRKA